jgi:hypothetical protein
MRIDNETLLRNESSGRASMLAQFEQKNEE